MMVELDDGLRDVLELLKAGQDLGSAVLNDVIAYLEREGWQSLGPNDERSRLYMRLSQCAKGLRRFEDSAGFYYPSPIRNRRQV